MILVTFARSNFKSLVFDTLEIAMRECKWMEDNSIAKVDTIVEMIFQRDVIKSKNFADFYNGYIEGRKK